MSSAHRVPGERFVIAWIVFGAVCFAAWIFVFVAYEQEKNKCDDRVHPYVIAEDAADTYGVCELTLAWTDVRGHNHTTQMRRECASSSGGRLPVLFSQDACSIRECPDRLFFTDVRGVSHSKSELRIASIVFLSVALGVFVGPLVVVLIVVPVFLVLRSAAVRCLESVAKRRHQDDLPEHAIELKTTDEMYADDAQMLPVGFQKSAAA